MRLLCTHDVTAVAGRFKARVFTAGYHYDSETRGLQAGPRLVVSADDGVIYTVDGPGIEDGWFGNHFTQTN